MSASGVDNDNKKEGFTAPLGSAANGRLVFASGAAGLTIHADPSLKALARGRFAPAAPGIQVQDGLIIVQYRSSPWLGWPGSGRASPSELTLNASIPWEIEFRGGASRINANLRGVQLRSFDVLGGASQMLLALSKPADASFIYIAGGANQVTILRPADVEVRVQVQGGASQLAFDGRRIGSAGGETRLQSPGYPGTESRCDICIAGGASKVTIGYEGRYNR